MKGLVYLWQRIYFSFFRLSMFTLVMLFFPIWVLVYDVRRGQTPREKVKYKMSYRSGVVQNKMMFGLMHIFVLFILFIIVNFLSILIDFTLFDSLANVYVFMSMLSLPLIINYFILWRKNKYREYFRQFDKAPALEKLKWDAINFGIVAVVVLLMLWSFAIFGT